MRPRRVKAVPLRLPSLMPVLQIVSGLVHNRTLALIAQCTWPFALIWIVVILVIYR